MLAGVMDAWRGTLGSMARPSAPVLGGEGGGGRGGLNGSGSGALSDKRLAVPCPSDPRASIYHFVLKIRG